MGIFDNLFGKKGKKTDKKDPHAGHSHGPGEHHEHSHEGHDHSHDGHKH